MAAIPPKGTNTSSLSGSAGEATNLPARSGTGAERPPNAGSRAKPFQLNAGADHSIPAAVWVTNAHDRLALVHAEIVKEGYRGPHINAIEEAADALDGAYAVVKSAGDMTSVQLGDFRKWIEVEKAEAGKRAATVSTFAQADRDSAAEERAVEKRWRERAITEVEEKLRTLATDVEKRAVDAMLAAEKAIGAAWDRSLGPLVFSLSAVGRPINEVALEVEVLRDEMKTKRMQAIGELLRGYIERKEEDHELVFTLAVAPLVDETIRMDPAKLAAKIAGRQSPRAGEADKEVSEAMLIKSLIEKRRLDRVPKDVLFAKQALPILSTIFDVLLGEHQLYMSNDQFAARYMKASAKTRAPYSVMPNWSTRVMTLPPPSERKLVGLPRY